MGSEVQVAGAVDEAGSAQSEADWGFSSAGFNLLAEHVPQMVWICQPDGRLDYLNSHGREYFGSALNGGHAQFPHDVLVHPEDRNSARTAWQQALASVNAMSVETRLLRADGAFCWHLMRAQPVHNHRGELIKWMGTSANVHSAREGSELNAFLLTMSTDFARMDNPHELVSTAMHRLRQRLRATQVTLIEFDHDRGEVVMLRQRGADASELEVVSLPLEPFRELCWQGSSGQLDVQQHLGTEASGGLYERWYGMPSVGALISAPLLQAGALVASLNVVEQSARQWSSHEIELTRRVAELVWPALEKARADHALAMSEQRLRLAQAVAQVGAWELNADAQSIHFTSESGELFGLTSSNDGNLYQLWTSLIDERDRGLLQVLIDECNTRGSGEAEYRYRHPVRGTRWIHSRAGRVDDAIPHLIVGISLDVTERRKAEEALKEVNQRKDEFLSMLAHELRNPLAPIRNAAQILRAHSNGKPELEWANTIIERQTRHLVRLVDDLLDVSRMLRGKIVLRKTAIDVADLVQHAVDTSQPLIRSRHHRLHVNLAQRPLLIDGDLTRLAQALGNLLNNAAKYTEEGGEIWLDAWMEGGQAVLQVRDSGPGLPPTLLPHVFDLFTQAERTLDRSQGGLGIGLTLVKLLIEKHGGTVQARNCEGGNGAEFLVWLPAVIPADATETPATHTGADVTMAASPAAKRPLRVLVVDDNVDAADSIALLLSIDGFEASSVHGALAALEKVAAFRPDVVLLDIGLPVMDGYEVAQRLRARFPVGQVRIVALSGYGQQADRDRATQAGFDDYLVKPVEPTVLTDFLRALK